VRSMRSIWVPLIQALPQTIQDQVRTGVLSAHAAMKYLVPLARANEQAARQLAEAIAPLEPSSRQVGALYQAWQNGTERTRELILSHPQVYLQAQAAQAPTPASPAQAAGCRGPRRHCPPCAAPSRKRPVERTARRRARRARE